MKLNRSDQRFPGERLFLYKRLKMYNSLFNVLDYVRLCSGRKILTSHPGNIEHSQTIMNLLTDLPYYKI